jgi:small-conductance mechanosensitive channel
VHSRQFTGRIVTVTNDKVFDCPVYNYTHDFAYIWDEISVPLRFHQDFDRAERIILDAAKKYALSARQLGDEEVNRLDDRFGLEVGQIDARVFWRLTENWLELTVRFLAPDHGVRIIKDQMTREIVAGLDKAKIAIAAVRQEAVGE